MQNAISAESVGFSNEELLNYGTIPYSIHPLLSADINAAHVTCKMSTVIL